MEENIKDIKIRFIWTQDVKTYNQTVTIIQPQNQLVLGKVEDIRKLPKLGTENNNLIQDIINSVLRNLGPKQSTTNINNKENVILGNTTSTTTTTTTKPTFIIQDMDF
jgi:hypothetical protein